MEVVRVTEAAALAASRLMGRGDEEAADRAAADAMHEALMGLAVDGTIRIGEGTADEAAKLYVGEKVGSGERPEVDVALLPLEGPTIIAKGEPNGVSVIAMAENGGFLNVPNVYMDKIAVGCGLPRGVVDLDREPARNLADLARAKGVEVGDLVVCALDRPRHQELIAKTREAGARIMLIADGDVSGVIATTQPASGVDVYMGIGSAREGVLAAAALGCIGAQMQTRLVLRGDDDRNRVAQSGITDFDRKYDTRDMASGELTFAATGVTGGALLRGVRTVHGGAVTQSMVLGSTTGTLRYIEAHHDFAAEVASGPAGT
jgi:fructose-1,6-bisphosphatase II / sedoheptulose-1,7-bisphosphatase